MTVEKRIVGDGVADMFVSSLRIQTAVFSLPPPFFLLFLPCPPPPPSHPLLMLPLSLPPLSTSVIDFALQSMSSETALGLELSTITQRSTYPFLLIMNMHQLPHPLLPPPQERTVQTLSSVCQQNWIKCPALMDAPDLRANSSHMLMIQDLLSLAWMSVGLRYHSKRVQTNLGRFYIERTTKIHACNDLFCSNVKCTTLRFCHDCVRAVSTQF